MNEHMQKKITEGNRYTKKISNFDPELRESEMNKKKYELKHIRNTVIPLWQKANWAFWNLLNFIHSGSKVMYYQGKKTTLEQTQTLFFKQKLYLLRAIQKCTLEELFDMEQLKRRMDYDSSMYKDWYRRKLEEGSSNMEHIPVDEFDFGITMVNEKIKMIKEDAQKLIGVTLWERKKPETPEEERELHEHLPDHISSFLGGKKRKTKKTKKTRKHKGIVQTGGNKGKLRKGYKYTGKKLKNGMAEIKKVKSKK